MKFIFLPDISCCSFDASLLWNGCILMSFTSLIGIYTFVKGNVGFAIGICAGRGGSVGGITLGLFSGTLFLGRHTGLAPCQVLHFCLDLTFAICLVIAALRSC